MTTRTTGTPIQQASCVIAGLLLACASPDEPTSPGILLAPGGGGSGVTVAATDPPFGNRGEQAKAVTITGNGFAPGAVAEWQRNGAADPKIQVLSTQYVSATKVVATINIAGDATVAFYSVAITNPNRKRGIGTEMFEVTQAVLVPGMEFAFGINDNGEVAGRSGPPGASYFHPASGLEILGAPGRAFDISFDGSAVVGFTGVCCFGAFVFERSGTAWVLTVLPKGLSAWANAKAVGSDPTTGAAVLVGGFFGDGYNNALKRSPVLWYPGGGGWTAVPLPEASDDDVLDDAIASGLAVGMANGRAAAWEPNGAGGWALSFLGAAGSRAFGVNSPGTIIVGEVTTGGKTTAARYWLRSGSSWTGPTALPGGCSTATAVDDYGRILANGCLNGSRRVPALILPPYSTSSVIFLGGLGDPKNPTVAEDISRSGTWIVGQSKYKGADYGVRWGQVF